MGSRSGSGESDDETAVAALSMVLIGAGGEHTPKLPRQRQQSVCSPCWVTLGVEPLAWHEAFAWAEYSAATTAALFAPLETQLPSEGSCTTSWVHMESE